MQQVEKIGSSAGPRIHNSVRSWRSLPDSATATRVPGWAVALMRISTRSRNLFEYATGTRYSSLAIRVVFLYIKCFHEDQLVSLQQLMLKRGNLWGPKECLWEEMSRKRFEDLWLHNKHVLKGVSY